MAVSPPPTRVQAREKTINSVGEEAMKRRAEHLRRQRDILRERKKAERQAALRKFEDERAASKASGRGAAPKPAPKPAAAPAPAPAAKPAMSEAEKKRMAMRIALARRMKADLIAAEQERSTAVRSQQVRTALGVVVVVVVRGCCAVFNANTWPCALCSSPASTSALRRWKRCVSATNVLRRRPRAVCAVWRRSVLVTLPARAAGCRSSRAKAVRRLPSSSVHKPYIAMFGLCEQKSPCLWAFCIVTASSTVRACGCGWVWVCGSMCRRVYGRGLGSFNLQLGYQQ